MKIKLTLPNLSLQQKSDLWKIVVARFLILFTYPMIRSVSSTFFIGDHGASDLPIAWFLSVLVLAVSILLLNRFQIMFGVHKLFAAVSIFSCLLFVGYYVFQGILPSWSSYALLVWKEVYIVILVHLIMAYTNSLITLDQMKTLYGPFGAMGSLGGILGGVSTSLLADLYGYQSILFIAALLLLIPPLFFMSTTSLAKAFFEKNKDKKYGPLEAVRNVKSYVFLIAAMVALSQFCINIADLKFNLLFEQVVTDPDQRTKYYGLLYTSIDTFTLIVQFFVLPFLLNTVSTKKLMFFVPLLFLLLSFGGLGLGAGLLWSVALSFVSFKGVDYSLFSTVKEILYHPMNYVQKYGAKYISDMFTYRTAKSGISLLLIFFQEGWILNTLMAIFLVSWIVVVRKVFIIENKLFKEKLT